MKNVSSQNDKNVPNDDDHDENSLSSFFDALLTLTFRLLRSIMFWSFSPFFRMLYY